MTVRSADGIFEFSADGKQLKVRKRNGVYTITVGESYPARAWILEAGGPQAAETATVLAITPHTEGMDPRVMLRTSKRRTAALAWAFVGRYAVPIARKEKKPASTSLPTAQVNDMEALIRIEAKLDFIMKTLGVSLEDPVVKAAVDAAASAAKTLPPTLGG